MKKFLAMILALIMIMSMAACVPADDNSTASTAGKNDPPASSSNQGGENKGPDMSAYPAFADWTAETMIQYLKDEKVFTDDSYFTNMGEADLVGTGMSYNCNYMSPDATVYIMFLWFNEKSEDATVKEHFDYVKANKTTNEATGSLPVDRLVGPFAFTLSMNADIDITNACNAALDKLAQAYGL